ASSRAFLGSRPPHADALVSVPTSYFPTSRLVDSLDARVDDPSARCAIWRGDDFPLPARVGPTIADPEAPLGGSYCRPLIPVRASWRGGSTQSPDRRTQAAIHSI